MELMFEIAPRLPEIRASVKLSDLMAGNENDNEQGNGGATPSSGVLLDPEEEYRQKLRQEAMDAAQVAAIAKAEADSILGPTASGATHTVIRSSEVEAQKAARKAAKRAEQAMKKAKAAGAILDESELINVDTAASEFGHGGLMMQTEEELRAMQQQLLPEGSRKFYGNDGLPSDTIREFDEKIGFERVIIPPPRLDPSQLHARLKIEDILDPDCARAFAGTTSLNPMQSTVFDTAFHRRENMLVCAPTGAGKTNVAMLVTTAHFRDVGLIGNVDSVIETGKKVVYIAPMKALAQEVVEKFSSKLKPLGLIVRELTGDMQLTRAEAQSANVLVTTPEKWDVVTRKAGNDENSLGNQCGLLVIDEVHLLADERGAVIESVVSRLNRLVESRQKQFRIVGLSATLPNYLDVAEFLQVPERGVFYFGPEHRPVPLQQTFVGVTGRVKDRNLMEKKMNQVCYETVKDSLQRGYQVMVFVHSRKGTSDTATALAEAAAFEGELDRLFVPQGEGPNGEAVKRFKDKAMKSRNAEVRNHFSNGLGIHHAGMLRQDRNLTEKMFAEGAIKVLCCTATLAWGINLPAHSVVVKGTDVYNPEKGKNVDLSILDVQQIFGRAGRPQFDNSGEATLITNHEALARYLDKLVRAVPIESSFIKQLADHLNAEIVAGTVTNVREASTWLSYTYLYVRMLKNPLAYGINADQKADDPMLRSYCLELVKQAAALLRENKMINYDPLSGNLGMTSMGRVAAHFYVQAESVNTFNEMMTTHPNPNDADLLHIIASANEFENVRLRPEEQSEMDFLGKKCPLTLHGPIHDSATKVFVLMQMYIAREKVKGFTLISDMNYIASNASRIARAMFEMCLNTDKAGTALKLLRFAKSFDNRFWWFQTPLRHFEGEIGINILRGVEGRKLGESLGYDSFEAALSLLDMTQEEVGQICRAKKDVGAKVQAMVRTLPKPRVKCRVMPVTRTVLRFHLQISPDFKWKARWHGGAVSMWVWVEDIDSGKIYHHEHIIFSRRNHPEDIVLDLSVPVFEPIPSQYIVRVLSDNWVGVEVVHPVSLRNISLPKQETTFTDLLDLTPLPTSALQDDSYEQLYSHVDTFNPVQTQLFHVLYHTDTPVLLGAPTGSGKTFVAEIALLRMKKMRSDSICVYIAPLKSLARERLKEWTKRFGSPPLRWKILELSGDTSHDSRAIEKADVLVCTPEKWDLISRNWRQSSFIKRVRLLVIDEIHLLGEERGAVLEALVSRTRFISKHLKHIESSQKDGDNESEQVNPHELVRIVGLSTAVANPLDLADWMGIETNSLNPTARRGLYNFRPSIRPVPTTVHVQGYPGKHYCPRMATMNKPCYAAIKQHSPDNPSLIFVASRRQTRLTAFDLISHAAGDETPKSFLGCDESYIESVAETIHDEALRHTITFGIGLHHAGLSSNDRDIVERMYLSGDIRVLVATATLAWGVNLPARLVIVKGTEYFDGKSSRYVDYPLTDVLQMIGRAGRPGFDTEGRAVVLVESSKKNFYKKFLYQPFPVESCLEERLCENLNAEIATDTVTTIIDAVGYLSWTFYARRLRGNPTYYGLDSSEDEAFDAFLLSKVKETVLKLKKQGCVEFVSEDDIGEPLVKTSLGVASSNYYLNHRTPKQMQFGAREARKMILTELQNSKKSPTVLEVKKLVPFDQSERVDEVSAAWILYSLSCTHEFDELPVRHNEEILNEELSEELMWGPDTAQLLSNSDEYRYVNP